MRTPHPTTTCVAIVDDDEVTRGKLTVFCEAQAIWVEGLTAGTDANTNVSKNVEARLCRLRRRIS